MPPKSPLPQRFGLDAAWVRTPDRDKTRPAAWQTMSEWLHFKLGEFIEVDQYLDNKLFVYGNGSIVFAHDSYNPNTFVWFHRELRDEAPVPGEMPIVFQDERLIVVDKPPFLSSIPRGVHVLQSVVAKLRAKLDLPELTPAHRLDRMTSGLLILTTEKRWRGPYQLLFQNKAAEKTYFALAARNDGLDFPITVNNHLRKRSGEQRVNVIADLPPNASSTIEVESTLADHSIYRLTPHTGKTHQLRQHMSSVGLPIVGDPLFPEVKRVALDDFSTPLQLLAKELSFIDPVDGVQKTFLSERSFPITAG